MSDNSAIEWTDATWSPVTGCTRVSTGCDHCYIQRTPPFRMAHRKFDGDGPGSTTGVITHPERLVLPLRWKKPRRIFVNSMADLFHDEVTDDYTARTFAVMAMTPRHTFQVLTKRPARMRSLLSSDDFWDRVSQHEISMTFEAGSAWSWARQPLPNVWLGVSVENQRWAGIRIPALLDTPAAVHFLSCEPLLGPIDLATAGHLARDEFHRGIDWLIAGGESGPGARPMHPDWARSLRDQCQAAGVPFLFKQWGEWRPTLDHATHRVTFGGDFYLNPGTCLMSAEELISRLGKKRAGRVLDGRTWDEYPERAA